MEFEELWEVEEGVYFLSLEGLKIELESVELECEDGW